MLKVTTQGSDMTDHDSFTPVLNEAIKPNSKIISHILCDGDIAVVVYKPSAKNEYAARWYGWDGNSAVFRMSHEMRQDGIRASNDDGDWITRDWLARESYDRILVIAYGGTLLLNVSPQEGLTLEPGQENERWAR